MEVLSHGGSWSRDKQVSCQIPTQRVGVLINCRGQFTNFAGQPNKSRLCTRSNSLEDELTWWSCGSRLCPHSSLLFLRTSWLGFMWVLATSLVLVDVSPGCRPPCPLLNNAAVWMGAEDYTLWARTERNKILISKCVFTQHQVLNIWQYTRNTRYKY